MFHGTHSPPLMQTGAPVTGLVVACSALLMHVPAETLWVEWCNEPWKNALQQYGFALVPAGAQWVGRRGARVRSSRDGRRGLVRTFWSASGDDVLASSVEAFFDFDTPAGEDPEPQDRKGGFTGRVYDSERSDDDILGRCFRFRYEQSWSEYYGSAAVKPKAIQHVFLNLRARARGFVERALIACLQLFR
jgi:hypothetical protein